MAEQMFKVVSLRDPAIDWAAMTEKQAWEYAESREFDLLKFKPDVKPQVFTLREVPFFYWAGGVVSPNRTAQDFTHAFRACIESVQDRCDKRDASIVYSGDQRIDRKDGAEMLDLRTVQELFEPHTMFEIGAVAYERSLFPSATGRFFPVLPICREFLARQTFRSAE